MASSSFVTPRRKLQTPKDYVTPKQIKVEKIVETPECFAGIKMETPVAKRSSCGSLTDKYDEVSNLTVAVRVRPMNQRELSVVGAHEVVKIKDKDLIVRSQSSGNLAVLQDHVFNYDHIFWSCDEQSFLYANQEQVYLTIGKPLLDKAFRGYNACLLAYGQTGSGKSFSMMGPSSENVDCESLSGITPRFCRDLFKEIANLQEEEASIEVSYFEIYNEKIHDLLNEQTGSGSKPALRVREHPAWGPYVVDLSVHSVKNYKQLRQWLLLGNKNRATAATAMNENSSRSHSIFSIELCFSEDFKQSNCRRSRVSLVDLAGSERLTLHRQDEKEKLRQGVSINKSLLTLGKVISNLADQKRNHFVPYRESVITWLLKESLGGNSLTSMLATITPASTHLEETLSTLRYACQARSITNRARINENPHERLIRELRSEVERLRALRQDELRSSSWRFSLNNETKEELEVETNSKLIEAQNNLQEKCKEVKQLQETIGALESKLGILQLSNEMTEFTLVPYQSTFLEELEKILNDDQNKVD